MARRRRWYCLQAFSEEQLGTVPVYEYYNDERRDHEYTTRDKPYDGNWRRGDVDVAFYAYTSEKEGTVPIYEYYSDKFQDHEYSQRDRPYDGKWRKGDQGVAFYAYPSDWTSEKAAFDFVLASAPEHELPELIQLTNDCSGHYCAGDKDDQFDTHALAIAGKSEQWKAAWLGKVHGTIQTIRRFNPQAKICVVAVAGGPACDWERGVLQEHMSRKYFGDNVVLKQIRDVEDFQHWLARKVS